jgi:hypothetical protein
MKPERAMELARLTAKAGRIRLAFAFAATTSTLALGLLQEGGGMSPVTLGLKPLESCK